MCGRRFEGKGPCHNSRLEGCLVGTTSAPGPETVSLAASVDPLGCPPSIFSGSTRYFDSNSLPGGGLIGGIGDLVLNRGRLGSPAAAELSRTASASACSGVSEYIPDSGRSSMPRDFLNLNCIMARRSAALSFCFLIRTFLNVF